MNEDIEITRRYQALFSSATSRNLEFDLSFKEFKKIYNSKKCFYTNKKLYHKNNFSIDRVDNSKGYVNGNIVACTVEINRLKSNMSINEIILLYNAITKFNNKNNNL